MQRSPSRASAAGGPSQLPRRLPRRLVAAAAADQAQGVLRRTGVSAGGHSLRGRHEGDERMGWVADGVGGGQYGRGSEAEGERRRGRDGRRGRGAGDGTSAY